MVQALPQPSVVTGQQVNTDAIVNIMRTIAGEHRTLMIIKREADIEHKLKDVSNQMSRRAIDHDLRVIECTTNIKKSLMVGPNILLASSYNVELVNRAIALVLAAVQEIGDRARGPLKALSCPEKCLWMAFCVFA